MESSGQSVALLILLPAASVVISYIALYWTAWSIGNKLRTPPSCWKEYLLQAINAGARLPSFGNKENTIRRQLILASSNVAVYTNIVGLSIGKVDKSCILKKFRHDDNKKVIFGFFHLYANAGGGGERVLWAAVKQTLDNSPNNVCAIYTGLEPSVTTGDILEHAERRFGIAVERERVVFIFLSNRGLVDPDTWPRFTILGQAIGSLAVAYEAINHLVPDVWVDTMGQPFSYPLISWVLNIPICAYVHYPVVSSDMLAEVSKFSLKWWYWKTMQLAYTVAGSYATVVVTNSSWTQNHIQKIWWMGHDKTNIEILYPPCATQDFHPDFENPRQPVVVCIAQFRPEKRHDLLLREFARFLKEFNSDETHDHDQPPSCKPNLMLIGSVRNDQDKSRVYSLRLLARELELSDDQITFFLDAPWAEVSKILQLASFGVNAMWNEHFGMVFVEYMAAGLIPIGHDSAGPKMDIIKDEQGRPGFLFTSETDPDYTAKKDSISLAECFKQAFAMTPHTEKNYRKRCAVVAGRFSDEAFADGWDAKVEVIKKLNLMKRKKRLQMHSFD